jgi:hypothetical protein
MFIPNKNAKGENEISRLYFQRRSKKLLNPKAPYPIVSVANLKPTSSTDSLKCEKAIEPQ